MPGDASEEAVAHRAAAPRRNRWVARVAVAVVALVLVAAAWVAVRAVIAAGELAAIQSDLVSTGIRDAPDDVSAETLAAIIPRLPGLCERAAHAREMVGDPVWLLSEHMPFAGAPLRTLRVLSEQSDALLGGTALPLLSAVAAARAGFEPGSAIDMDALRRLAATLDDAGERVEDARAALLAIDNVAAGARAEAGTRLLLSIVSTADEALGPLRVLTSAAPELLGAQDHREYLLLFLTPAELRAGGGLPGAAAIARFHDGAALGVEMYSTRDFHPAPAAPVVPLTPTELELYGDRPARVLQDTTATDDFGRTGEFARALTQFHHGVSPTGVLAIDIIALGYLLEVTGPVALQGGDSISAENSAELLMNTVYKQYPDPADQDAYFAMVTERFLDAATTRALDPSLLAAAVARGVHAGRIQAWSSEPSIQTALVALGATDPPAPVEGPAVGVHVNDRTGAKMDYYLTASAEVEWTACTDGRRFDQVRVTLENKIAAADVAALPWYVTGDGSVVPKGDIATQIVVTGAIGSTVVVDPGSDTVTRDEADRPRLAWTEVVGPGGRSTQTVLFESSYADGAPEVDTTPALLTDVRESQGALVAACEADG